MIKHRHLHALLTSIVIAVAATACVKASSNASDSDVMEWDVTLHVVAPEFNRPEAGDGLMYQTYAVADTARVMKAYSEMNQGVDYSFIWSEPNADGNIGVVIAYETKPILSDKVTVIKAKPIPSTDEFINLELKFNNVNGLDTATSYNVGHRLALVVNGKFIDAPTVNGPIEDGDCLTPIPIKKLNEYFPNLDLEKLKQK